MEGLVVVVVIVFVVVLDVDDDDDDDELNDETLHNNKANTKANKNDWNDGKNRRILPLPPPVTNNDDDDDDDDALSMLSVFILLFLRED